MKIYDDIKKKFDAARDREMFLYELREFIHRELSPLNSQPIDLVRWVPIEKVESNDYNPNSVAKVEMRLLYTSILHDGYTQPVVTVMEKRSQITFPCGHLVYLNETNNRDSELWNIIQNLLKESVDIPLASLTPTELSGLQGLEMADTEYKSAKLLVTTDEKFANGFGMCGKSDGYMNSSVIAILPSGTLPASTISSTCSVLVCPTCMSRDKKRKMHWSFFKTLVTVYGEVSGVLVSCLTSENTDLRSRPQSLAKPSDERPKPLDGSEMSLECFLLRVEDQSKYIIVDGFHRYFTCKTNKDILERNHGKLPVVVIDKDINDRMASTVRHNRARGKHSVAGMSSMVFSMLDNGWTDEAICNELGMEPEELLKLKHITGFSKLFADTEYNRAWKTKRQIRLEKEVREAAQ